MTSIWATDTEGWRLLAPIGFPDESALHELVEGSPELLPLSGSPQLVVLGHEVPIGGGYADIVAVEPSGRVVLIEVKLASNAEARRAVVAQILAYAAFLKGTDPALFEREMLRSNLQRLGHQRVADVAEAQDQDGSFDPETFQAGLEDSLQAGRFRLVLVLDDAPVELVRLIGYLESVAPELVIDLVTVGAYEVDGSRVLVPQRVDAERPSERAEAPAPKPTKQGYLISPEEFRTGIKDAPPDDRPALEQMFEWAKELEAQGLIRLLAYRGTTGRTTLLPYLLSDDAGLITIWNDGNFYLSFWRSVFERRAPSSISAIEHLIAPIKIGQGNAVREVSDDLLAALKDAYAEAAS